MGYNFSPKRPTAEDSSKTITIKKLGLGKTTYGLETEEVGKVAKIYAAGTGAVPERAQITRQKTSNYSPNIELVDPLDQSNVNVRCSVRADEAFDVTHTDDATFHKESTAYCTISFGEHPSMVGAQEEYLLQQAVSMCYDDDGNFRVPSWMRGALQPTN